MTTRRSPVTGPPCILSNGRLPMWAKRLLGEVDNSDSVAPASRVCYQPQGRWAERAAQEPIKSMLGTDLNYFTPIKNDCLSDTELEPQNLEQLLSQSESSPANAKEDCKEPGLTPEDEALQELESLRADKSGQSVQTTSDPAEAERSPKKDLHLELTFQMEATNVQEKRPNKMYSAVSLDSEASLFGQPQEVLDQESSVSEVEADLTNLEEKTGSLPQTPEQEKYLRHHFETLAEAHSEEKFDGTLKDLKLPEDEDEEAALFLNPRLSISARFLSRCRFPRVHQPAQPILSVPDQVKEENPLPRQPKMAQKPSEGLLLELEDKPENKTCRSSESQVLIKRFETNLQSLCSGFQETLQLYDKVMSCKESSREELVQVKELLLRTSCWMTKELGLRAVKDSLDVATATDSPSSLGLRRLHDDKTF